MIRVLTGILVTLSAYPAISLMAKGTVVLAFGLIGAWFARRSRAAVRHALLASVFSVLLALPIVSLVATPVPIAVPVAKDHSNVWPLFDNVPAPSSGEPEAERSSAIPAKSGWSLFPLATMLLYGWFIGTVLFMIPIVRGLLQIRSLRRFGLPWRHAQGARRRVEILLHESLPGPMTCGVLHPVIILPADAQRWNKQDLERAFIHELEHVRRYDWPIHCLARVACAAYWFHPLVWIAWRRLKLEAELSCDDAVLRSSEATAYADQLVGLARRRSVAGKSPVLAMAGRSDLAARVGALLDVRQRRGPVGALLVAAACVAAVAVALTVSPLRIVAAPQMAAAQPAANAPAFEVASVKAWSSGRVGGVTIEYSSNSITLRGIDLWIGLQAAYGLRDFQLSGPERLKMAPAGSGNRYDILAKASGPVSNDQLRLMLRTLLTERFHMAVHLEKKEMPVLALLVAKGGPKFHETAAGTEVDSTWAGFANVRHELVRGPDGRGGHSFTNAPMTALAAALSASMPYSPEPVVDMTGLPGRFDFVLHDAPRPASTEPPNFDDMIAAQKTIVQDELGLTWERRKAPVDVLVVDRTDNTPTEN